MDKYNFPLEERYNYILNKIVVSQRRNTREASLKRIEEKHSNKEFFKRRFHEKLCTI